MEALRRVKANKGSAGIDGMTVGQLRGYLKEHWLTIREQLLNGTYNPQPVRRVEIVKPDVGGMRKLGIESRTDQGQPFHNPDKVRLADNPGAILRVDRGA
jgi:RNA-directed DNA polymerase